MENFRKIFNFMFFDSEKVTKVWTCEPRPKLYFYQQIIRINEFTRLYMDRKYFRYFVRAVVFAGIIVLGIRILNRLNLLVNLIIESDGSVFNEDSNRRLASMSLDFTALFLLVDKLTNNSVLYARKFDSMWSNYQLSMEQDVVKAIEKGSHRIKWEIILYITCQIAMSAVTFFYIWRTEEKSRVFFSSITRITVYMALAYLSLFMYRLRMVELYITTGFRYIQWRIEEKLQIDSSQLNVSLIQNYRNLYEDLAAMVDEFGKMHSLMVNAFYVTVVPRIVTTVYDVVLTGGSFKLIHALQIGVSLFRLYIFTSAANSMHESATNPCDALQFATMEKPEETFLLEVSLFLDRINQQNIGMKLFNYFMITKRVASTILTMVVTYFIAVGSLNHETI